MTIALENSMKNHKCNRLLAVAEAEGPLGPEAYTALLNAVFFCYASHPHGRGRDLVHFLSGFHLS
jgi:hypothetical protein